MQIAKKMMPLFDEYGLAERTFAYIIDGGGNMSTTMDFLDGGINVADLPEGIHCKATGNSRPLRTRCFAHAINGACNGSVIKAKEATFLPVKQALTRFQSCITYIKKSSKR